MDLDEEELKATKKLNEKSADEMFEEMGYIKYIYGDVIEYKNCTDDTIIGFDNEYKEIYVSQYNTKYQVCTIEELKAINKKCKELGWIE